MLTGTPDRTGWSQTHFFNSKDTSSLLSKNELFVVLSIGGEQSIEKTRLSRELLGRLYKNYVEAPEGPYLSLKKAVSRGLNDYSGSLGTIETAILVPVNNVLYMIATGGAGVVVIRNGRLIPIIDFRLQEQNQASGLLQDLDTLVLGTSKFFTRFSQAEILNFLTISNLKDSAEMFTKDMYADSENGRLGALIVRFDRKLGFQNQTGEALEIGNAEPQVKKAGNVFLGEETLVDKHRGDLKSKRGWIGYLRTKTISVLKRLPERKFYVTDSRESPNALRKRKMFASAGILLLTLLILSIIFGIRQKKIGDYKSSYQTELAQAIHQLDEADEVFSLNPARSRELFSSSKAVATKLNEQKIKDPEIAELTKRLDDLQGKILGEYRINTELYMDLSLLSNGFQGDKIRLSDERIFILDKNSRKIIGINLDTKRSEVIAGPSLVDEVDDIGAYTDKVFVSNSKGILEVKDKLIKVIDKDWNGEVLIYPYAGNFYVLEKDTSTIWRYVGSAESFGSKRNWLADGVVVDLSNVLSIAIDGSIWVLDSDGSILKFSLGNKQAFKAENIYPEMSKPKALFTDDQAQQLYILDSENSRIVVFDKEGGYKAQYISPEIKNTSSIVVSEKERKIILLTKEKLYSIELKHL